MLRRNLILSFLIFLAVFILTGCGEGVKKPIIDIGSGPAITKDNQDDQNYEVIRLSNGVVVYKDRSLHKKRPKEEKSEDNNYFGPKPIDFTPSSIKFNNN